MIDSYTDGVKDVLVLHAICFYSETTVTGAT